MKSSTAVKYLIALLLACLGSPVWAATLSVTPSTQANLQAVLSRARPGDVVELGAGTYRFAQGLTVQGLRDVTIRGAGGRVEIVVDNLFDDVITVSGCSGVVLSNLSAHHQAQNNTGCEGAVVHITNSSQVAVVECELNGCGAAGVQADASNDVVVSGCFLHNNSYAAVWVQGGSITIHGCNIEGNAMSLVTSGQVAVTMAGNTVRLNDQAHSLTPFARKIINQ